MKPFKKLTLTVSGLLVVAFSFSFTRPSEVNTSYRSNSIEFQLAAITADDVDDDFGDVEFLKLCQRLLEFNFGIDSTSIVTRSQVADPHPTSIPFYLQVRNLRI